MVNMGATMLSGLLVARVIEPSVLGYFASFQLILGYIPFLQLGVLNGLNRELPYYMGRGDKPRAYSLAASAQGVAILIGGAVAIALLSIGVWYLIRGDWNKFAGFATVSAGAFFLYYNKYYLDFTYRSKDEFIRLTNIGMIVAMLGLGFVPVVWAMAFYGLCIRSLVVGIVGLILMWHWRPVKVRPHLKKEELKHLLKIGAPILLVGQIYAWWSVINRTLILKYMGTEGLGLYTLVLLGINTVALLPLTVGRITYPRVALIYGQTDSFFDLIKYLAKPVILLCLGMVPVIVVAWIFLPAVAKLVVPKYEAAIPAAQWGLIVAFLMSFAPINNIFNVAKKQQYYLVAIVFGMVANFVALLWLIDGGVYLAAFPQAMVIGRITFIFLCYGFVFYLWFRDRRMESK